MDLLFLEGQYGLEMQVWAFQQFLCKEVLNRLNHLNHTQTLVAEI